MAGACLFIGCAGDDQVEPGCLAMIWAHFCTLIAPVMTLEAQASMLETGGVNWLD